MANVHIWYLVEGFGDQDGGRVISRSCGGIIRSWQWGQANLSTRWAGLRLTDNCSHFIFGALNNNKEFHFFLMWLKFNSHLLGPPVELTPSQVGDLVAGQPRGSQASLRGNLGRDFVVLSDQSRTSHLSIASGPMVNPPSSGKAKTLTNKIARLQVPAPVAITEKSPGPVPPDLNKPGFDKLVAPDKSHIDIHSLSLSHSDCSH